MPRPAVAALLVVLLAGCGGEDLPPPPPAPSQVTGTIIELTTAEAAPQEITALLLETSHGTHFEVFIDPDRDYGFDLSHLFEHQKTGDPVRLRLEQRGGPLYALRIDDA